MSKFFELLAGAVLGAVVAIVSSAYFVGRWAEKIETNSSELATLRNRIQSVEENLPSLSGVNSNAERTIIDGNLIVLKNEWGQEIQRVQTSGGRTIGNAAQCPRGYFAIGVEALDSDNGDYCKGCLTAIRLVCAPL